ncbi:hypothetical protein ACFX1X_014579 [Malus domestica]
MRMGLSTREMAPTDLIWKKRWPAGVRSWVRDGNVQREGMMGFGRAIEVGLIGRWVLVGDRDGARPRSVRVRRKDTVEDGGVGG